MVDRTKARKAVLRANVPWRVYDYIVHRACLHIDAWIVQTEDDNLYLTIERRIGGTVLLRREVYRLHPGQIIPVNSDRRPDGIQRHVNTAWARRYAPWLEQIHRAIRPGLHQRIHPSFTRPNNIHLHYVWSDPRVNSPTAGLDNLYEVTGRPGRDAARMTAATKAQHKLRQRATYGPETDPNSRRYFWNASERSILRTLAKILS